MDEWENEMKTVLVATFLCGLYVGISGTGGSFSPSNVVSQHCGPKHKAEIVFFENIRIDHPLGKDTCGDMNSIEQVGLNATHK